MAKFATRMEMVLMDREAIIAMLEELVEDIDYDIYKEIFVNPDDDEEAEETIDGMIKIVERHLK